MQKDGESVVDMERDSLKAHAAVFLFVGPDCAHETPQLKIGIGQRRDGTCSARRINRKLLCTSTSTKDESSIGFAKPDWPLLAHSSDQPYSKYRPGCYVWTHLLA